MSLNQSKGYQAKKTKLLQVAQPFGLDPIQQVIYCSYPDKSYLVAIKRNTHSNMNHTKIVVCSFRLDDDDGIHLEIPIISEYLLYPPETVVYNPPNIFNLKKEKCFLTVVQGIGFKELWKVEIESGNILWKKPTTADSFVEDDRGIVFCYKPDGGWLEIRDSRSGDIMNEIKTGLQMSQCEIGLDFNDNVILGGYDKSYSTKMVVINKRGKLEKTSGILNPVSISFVCQVDPFMKLTYIAHRSFFEMRAFRSDFSQSQVIPFGHGVYGFFFVKEYKYLFVCDTSNLYVYD